MGGSDNKDLEHNMVLENCLAFDNLVKGFDQNNNRGSMMLCNCTGCNNATNYSISLALDSGKVLIVKNCVALGQPGSLGTFAVEQTNSWMPPFVTTTADFLSIDTAGVRGPRKPDGTLPAVAFMHLADGSDLIDAGVNVGLPFTGSAPDLGCFESEGTTPVSRDRQFPPRFALEQNYPNPFNPETTIRFVIDKTGRTTLEVFDIAGEHVATLFDDVAVAGRTYEIRFNGSRKPSGVYFYQLRSNAAMMTRKFALVK
jgi:hypothetical protein